jgi:transposase
MGRPYSLDLRARVISAVGAGMSCRAAARHFHVGESTAIRWSKRARETGSVAALPMGGKRPFVLAAQGDWVLARLAEKPDITLRALLAELRARGVVVSYFGVWHFVDRAGLSFKKKPACQRTGSPRRGSPARSVAPTPGQG